MSVHYLSGSQGVPDVSLFQFVPVSQFRLVHYRKGLSSSGNKQTLDTCISLLGTLHMDIVQVAKIKATKDNVT